MQRIYYRASAESGTCFSDELNLHDSNAVRRESVEIRDVFNRDSILLIKLIRRQIRSPDYQLHQIIFCLQAEFL